MYFDEVVSPFHRYHELFIVQVTHKRHLMIQYLLTPLHVFHLLLMLLRNKVQQLLVMLELVFISFGNPIKHVIGENMHRALLLRLNKLGEAGVLPHEDIPVLEFIKDAETVQGRDSKGLVDDSLELGLDLA